MWFSQRESKRRRSSGPWMPSAPSRDAPLSAEQEAMLAHDDLAELLAATNAKRRARGKAELTSADVEMRVWSEEQAVHRRRSDEI